MKTLFKTIALSTTLILSLVLASCKKDETVIALTKTQILCGKNWKVTTLTVDPARPYVLFGPNVTDWYAQRDACVNDNLYYYNSDGTMKLDEGATKCNTSDAQTMSGTWTFNTDQTVITQTIGSNTTSYKIVELSVTTMKATYVETVLGTTYTFTITLKAQ